MRFCNECNDKKNCKKCNKQTNENKEFEANFNGLKRHPPNETFQMLPYYKIYLSTFCIKHLLYNLFFFILCSLTIFFTFSKLCVFKLRSVERQQVEHQKTLNRRNINFLSN